MGRLAEVAAGKDCRPSTLEPSPPAAFPLGHAAGGGISHSQRPANRMGRRPKPIGHGRPDQSPGGRTRPSPHSPLPRHPDRGDQRPPRPSLMDASNSHIPIP